MRRRTRFILILIIPAALLLAYWAYARFSDWQDERRLYVGCHSDKLYTLVSTAEAAARENAGHFPDSATIIARLDQAERTWLTTCVGSNRPFIWNPHLTELALHTPGRIPLAWCPPDSHGRHVGMIVLEAGRADCVMTTQSELAVLLKPQVSSAYPVAVDPAKVGVYPALTKSGAGHFYDDVLEYRVWIHPDGDDYYHAFATYEEAAAFAKSSDRAEEPLALVLQHEYINEPQPGQFEWVKGNRITEWQVAWLAGGKRGPTSIADFLKNKGKQTP